jgi:uncharacterized membrane protein
MSAELTLPATVHLAAVVPAMVIGVAQLVRPKGSRPHQVLGWIWVLAMIVGAASSFWIMGIRKGDGFSIIHLLSVWVLVSLGAAIWHIRRGNVRAHKRFMVGTLLGPGGRRHRRHHARALPGTATFLTCRVWACRRA